MGGAFIHLLVRVHLTQESVPSLPETTYRQKLPMSHPKLLSEPGDLQATGPCFSPTGYNSYLPGILVMAYLLKFCSWLLHRAKDSGLPYSQSPGSHYGFLSTMLRGPGLGSCLTAAT